jgi:hypothetical protein
MRESVGTARRVRKSRWIGVCAGIYTLRMMTITNDLLDPLQLCSPARSESVSSTAQQPGATRGRDLPGPPAHGRRWDSRW